ncbi:MAG: hypothetical protein ACE5KT_06375 [Methanosarcinales archaeon]
MSITVQAKIKEGIIVLDNKLDIANEDVLIRIEPLKKEQAIKTKIKASSELVEEILASEYDKLL